MTATTKHLFTGLRVAFGVALLWYLGSAGLIQWSALLGLVRAWPITAVALVILLVDVVITAWRLCVLMGALQMHLSLVGSTRLALIGLFFSTCLPGSAGGDVMRIYYATEGHRGRRTEVATVILLDRAIGLFALLIWPLLVLPLFPGFLAQMPDVQTLLIGAAVFAAVLLSGLLAACSVTLKTRLLDPLCARMPVGGAYAASVFETVHSYRHSPKALLASVGISLLAHTLSVAVTLVCIAAANPEGVAWPMAVLIPLGHLANTVPLTPGGLGVGEAAFSELFSRAGFTGGAEGLIGWRLLTIVLSQAGLLFYLQGRTKIVHLTPGDVREYSVSSAGLRPGTPPRL